MNAKVLQLPLHRAVASHDERPSEQAERRRAAIRQGFDSGHLLEEPFATCWAARAHHVLDQVEELLEHGDAESVMELCRQAVWCLEDSAPDIAEDEPLYELASRLGDLHLRACGVVRPEPVELAKWLFDAEYCGDLGAVVGGAEDYATLLGPAGLGEYRRLADEAWCGPGRRSAIARSIDEFRLKPILASLARAGAN